MPLSIKYVRSLADVVGPAVDFLSQPLDDLFSTPRIVVPHAGAKAWLAAKLAEELGAGRRDGRRLGDGIVANVEFLYPGTLSTLLSDTKKPPIDPWDVEHLTFTILQIIAANASYEQIVHRAGGPLLAARRIADRFDHYHFRRPGMILEWERGKDTLSPQADPAGKRIDARLKDRDRWQFDLWREARERIGQSSPPARQQTAEGSAPEAVMVAGLQGLSLHQVELLETLGARKTHSGRPCDVRVLLVHPSPTLRETWGRKAPPVSTKVVPARHAVDLPVGIDPLVDAWLRGTRESQWLLASQGHRPVHHGGGLPEYPAADGPLLTRLQHTVTTGLLPDPASVGATFEPSDDSVRIHRCHDLGRQAEVLHDAILHAFRDLPDLAPHEVVIVSPQIARLAPHLEAVFDRTVGGAGDEKASLHLPLLVADRGIREVSRGAELLAFLIELIGSRCSVDAMLAVAAHPLVLAHFGLDDDSVQVWQRCIERTKIRWGIDATRRIRGSEGLPELAAHSWRLGLERMLLGALVPDGDPEPVLGGVVPLRHVDAAEVTSLAPLVTIFGMVDDLDQTVAKRRSVAAWCDLLEATLVGLAGEENDELAVPLRELALLRQAAVSPQGGSSASVDVEVPWHDVKKILAATLTAPVGRQPLRTGAITATSLIPLRGVPFRVICLAGFDDEAVAPRETDSEDLVDRQELLGDLDGRLEIRRDLLDCLLAAQDRLVITCTGLDVKNNATLPLVTPLAEFTDFAGRHGVPPFERNGHLHSSIEVFHPRHACSRRNFLTGDAGVVPGDHAWSHDAAARSVARGLGKDAPLASLEVTDIDPPPHIELECLAEFMHDPLWPYVRKTLDINRWRDDDLSIPATLPLELDHLECRRLRDDYIKRLVEHDDPAAFARAWAREVRANGDVPVLGFGGDAIEEISQFSSALLQLARDEQVPLGERHEEAVSLNLDGVVLGGRIERCYPNAQAINTVVLLRPDAKKASSPQFLRAKMLAVVQLLAALAKGHPVQRALVFNQHEDWFPGAVRPNGEPQPAAQERTITLAERIDQAGARRLLHELCALYRQATVAPYGTFDKTAASLVAEPADPEKAREQFAACTSSRTYARSNEAVVYGGQPDFSQCFPDDERVRDFFRRFHALTIITSKYVYTPDATRP